MAPEQYTMPWQMMAWEKKGNGGGALSVLTASFIGLPRMVAELACEGSIDILDDDLTPDVCDVT